MTKRANKGTPICLLIVSREAVHVPGASRCNTSNTSKNGRTHPSWRGLDTSRGLMQILIVTSSNLLVRKRMGWSRVQFQRVRQFHACGRMYCCRQKFVRRVSHCEFVLFYCHIFIRAFCSTCIIFTRLIFLCVSRLYKFFTVDFIH